MSQADFRQMPVFTLHPGCMHGNAQVWFAVIGDKSRQASGILENGAGGQVSIDFVVGGTPLGGGEPAAAGADQSSDFSA